MISVSYVLDKLRDVKLQDYLAVFPMTAALIMKPFYKNKYEGGWLVCEEPSEARDNGYHFFRYMCRSQKSRKCFYAIKKSSVDYEKVKELGNVIEYGSIQHWLAYFLCEYNISSQKGGKPNAALCAFMELNGIIKRRNIFLQHGIIINNLRWLYAECSQIDKFIVSTIPEYDYLEENFGYPKGTVTLTGMPRHDALHDIVVTPNRVLIMPTWRYWFNINSKKHKDIDCNFETSDYLKKWLEVLDNPKMAGMIEKYKLEVIFYPHRNMQKNLHAFSQVKTPITIASWERYDIQELLKTSALLITDYSSVFFDMVYMKKPVIFYQFDEEKYRNYQYGDGYFDYHNNAFGKTFEDCEGVMGELEKQIMHRFEPSEEFLEEHRRIFKYWDIKNSERIFNMLSAERICGDEI